MTTHRGHLLDRSKRCAETFARVGDRVEREWARFDYDDAVLPQLAADALAECAPHRSTNGDDIVAWALSQTQFGAQPNAGSAFGQPPITVYSGRRFYIETLHWFDGTTSIHQHSFAGAFCVLEGGSVHTTYAFDAAKPFSPRLRLGDLRFQQSDLLTPGDAHPIHPGAALIHALFHMESPSVSVVIRNTSGSEPGIQYSYLPPYVAYDPFDRAVWGKRAETYLRGLIAKQAEDLDDFVALAFEHLDMLWAFRLYEQLCRRDLATAVGVAEPYAEHVRTVVAAAAAQKFGAYFPALAATVKLGEARDELIRLRKNITGADERFFLALMLNVPSRARLLALVAQRFPGLRAEAKIEQCMMALLNDHRTIGIAFEQDALELARGILRGESLAQTVRRLEGRHGALDAGEIATVAAALARLRTSPLLRPFAGVEDVEPLASLCAPGREIDRRRPA
jgi:hypothetical protein